MKAAKEASRESKGIRCLSTACPRLKKEDGPEKVDNTDVKPKGNGAKHDKFANRVIIQVHSLYFYISDSILGLFSLHSRVNDDEARHSSLRQTFRSSERNFTKGGTIFVADNKEISWVTTKSWWREPRKLLWISGGGK